MSAVVGVNCESGVVPDEAARHLHGIQPAALQLAKELAVEPINIFHVAKELDRLLGAQRRFRAFVPPIIQIALQGIKRRKYFVK